MCDKEQRTTYCGNFNSPCSLSHMVAII
jgi:hypothetical protein